MVVLLQIAPPEVDRLFGALADHTPRDIVCRASAPQGFTQQSGPSGFVRRLLDQYEELWRGRINRMAELISDAKETDR